MKFYDIFEILIMCSLLDGSVPALTTDRPIIGILAQEYHLQRHFPDVVGKSYIAASYVKAVECSGARVVPILVGESESYYRSLMTSINGVVIPGGAAPLEPGNGYYDAATKVYDIAVELNRNGTFFPVLGVCLGFEALLAIANQHDNPRVVCNVFHENYPLVFEPVAEKSLLYSNIPENIKFYLQHLPTTINYHIYCITPADFTKAVLLRQEWRVTTTNLDSYGFKFVSSVEHKNLPIIGVQFHPEKTMFEWNEKHNIAHSEHTIVANRYFYDFLVRLSKKNVNKFPTKQLEAAALIFNYAPIYSGGVNWPFEQIYVF